MTGTNVQIYGFNPSSIFNGPGSRETRKIFVESQVVYLSSGLLQAIRTSSHATPSHGPANCPCFDATPQCMKRTGCSGSPDNLVAILYLRLAGDTKLHNELYGVGLVSKMQPDLTIGKALMNMHLTDFHLFIIIKTHPRPVLLTWPRSSQGVPPGNWQSAVTP